MSAILESSGRRRCARQGVEAHIFVAEFGAGGDAVPIVVEVDGSRERHDLVALGECGRDLHVGDLLDLGQDRAEEDGQILRGDGERARVAEGFEQGEERVGEVGRHMVDRVVDQQEVRPFVEAVQVVRQEDEAAVAAALHQFHVDGGDALLDVDDALFLPLDRGLEGIASHEREEARERARREAHDLAVEGAVGAFVIGA